MAGKVLMRVEGMDGQVELMTDRVVIYRGGIWNALKYGFNARREIPLGAISEVSFKPAHALRWGEIEFVRSGRSGDEATRTKKANPNAVKFKRDKNEAFEMLKEKIFEILNQQIRQQRQ